MAEIVAECESVPLVAVTVTVYEPAVDELRVQVEVPEAPRETVVGMHVAVRPDGLTEVVRATLPVKPFTLAMVITTSAEEPTVKLTLVRLAEIVKSGDGVTLKVTDAEWDREPVTPVTVAVKVPVVEELQDRVDVPEPPVMLVEERVHDRLAGLVVTERLTVPAKPFRDAIVIMEEPVRPCTTVTLGGLADIVKSGTAAT
jgi:hypothetical protein